MCFQQLSNETLLAILGIAGTLLGTLGGAFFAYRSIDKQFSHSIKKMRIDRTFLAYESLLELVIEAQSLLFVKVAGQEQRISPMLVRDDLFRSWYSRFQPLWHQKQYLLDDKSLVTCKSIAEFIARFLEKFPHFRTGVLPENYQPKPTPEFFAEVVSLHTEFLKLLEAARQPLQAFLTHDIEKS